ncbi:MAG TPA: c-type cytochrome [Polyangiaceae bacterium]|nr:c-type cytochrome [Polyangiaceae bacterium]
MSSSNARKLCLMVFVAASIVGCQKSPSVQQAPSETQPVQAAPAAEPENDPALAAATAKSTFNSKCIVCHGNVGLGDGPGAAALNPKPRAFADAAWQGSVTDEQISKAIVEGGAAVGKSPNMPPNPELGDKPDVVKALVGIVRGFKKG